MRTRCQILALCFLLSSTLAGQPILRYNTVNYGVNEGLLQTTIGDLAIDQNNFCWITFPVGIQRFDGNVFTTIRAQPGLPDDKSVRLFRSTNGELLFSHSKGISKYEISTNRFVQVFTQDKVMIPAYFIGEDAGSIYIYDAEARIHELDSRTYALKSTFATTLKGYNTQYEQRPGFSSNIVDHFAGAWIGKNLILFDLRNKKIASQVSLPEASPFLLKLQPGPKAIYYNYSQYNAFQCFDFTSNVNSTHIINGKDDREQISRLITFRWGDKNLLSINNKLYETDSAITVLRAELVNYKNEPITGNYSIGAMVEDLFGNLYLQTINGGICKIIRNNYAIKYYGHSDRKKNAVLGILPDKKNNRILVGTSGSGLMIFDTLQKLTRHIEVVPGGGKFSVNAMVKIQNGDYLLYMPGQKGPWRLTSDLSVLKPEKYTLVPGYTPASTIDYFGSRIFQDEKTAIVQSMYHVLRTDLVSGQTDITRLTGDYVLDRLWIDQMILSHYENALVFNDAATYGEIKRIPFPNTGGVRCYARSPDGNILIGTNNGLYRIDVSGRVLQHWTKENGLPDDCIYAITTDGNEIWCSSNKGLFRIDPGNSILQLIKEDGLQENEFNTTVVAKTGDGEIFFGGMNGVSSFYPARIKSFDEKVNILVTRIRINNADYEQEQSPWDITNITTAYDRNSLSFDFVAMAHNNPGQYVYQYRMKGLDQEWVQSNGLQTIRYSLPPGKYTLELYASRSFDRNAQPVKEIAILVSAPFWKSWWFIGSLALIIFALLGFGINQQNKRKYSKRLQMLEHERQIKQERERISKDLHDNLGAYANAVLYNTERLENERADEKRKHLIGDIKFASKDIITSLRETVWALKKETYSAEDCLLRIKNFIQPLTRYYSDIHFKVIGEAPDKVELHYTKALNLVRIVQEAVTNSLKHAHPSHIIISSESQGDRWKLVIQDDGKSFDYTEARKAEQGNGLYNMEHRAVDAGFGFELHSTPQNGTTISLLI